MQKYLAPKSKILKFFSKEGAFLDAILIRITFFSSCQESWLCQKVLYRWHRFWRSHTGKLTPCKYQSPLLFFVINGNKMFLVPIVQERMWFWVSFMILTNLNFCNWERLTVFSRSLQSAYTRNCKQRSFFAKVACKHYYFSFVRLSESQGFGGSW